MASLIIVGKFMDKFCNPGMVTKQLYKVLLISPMFIKIVSPTQKHDKQ